MTLRARISPGKPEPARARLWEVFTIRVGI